MKERPFYVGVAGGSASGKTTIVDMIGSEFKDDIIIIGHDVYYYPYSELSFEQRLELNYDHPESFDTARLLLDLKCLEKNKEVDIPRYDYKRYTRSQETQKILIKPIVLVEGILIFENKELRDKLDLKIFVDADADERLVRRVTRDTIERGRNVESVLNQYVNTVKPMHEQFVEPSKKYADIIVPRGGKNEVAIDVIKRYLRLILEGSKEVGASRTKC